MVSGYTPVFILAAVVVERDRVVRVDNSDVMPATN